jgi:hypothetical protein
MNNLFEILLDNNRSFVPKTLLPLKKKISYIKTLSNKLVRLNNLIQLDHFKNLYIKEHKNSHKQKNFLIMYVITISFLKANTAIHVSDAKGNVKFFYNAGSVHMTGKQKKRRVVVLFKLLKLLLNNSSVSLKTPIALHLNNVTRYKNLIVKRLKKKVFVKVLKEFNQVPYNGCRQSKIRRRKRLKNKFI